MSRLQPRTYLTHRCENDLISLQSYWTISVVNVRRAVTCRRRRGSLWLDGAVAHTEHHLSCCFAKATDDSPLPPPPSSLISCGGHDQKHVSRVHELQLHTSAFLCHVRRHHLRVWLTTERIRSSRGRFGDGTFPSCSPRHSTARGEEFGSGNNDPLPAMTVLAETQESWRRRKRRLLGNECLPSGDDRGH